MKNIQISDDTHKLVKQFLLDEGLKTLDAAIGVAVVRAMKGTPARQDSRSIRSCFFPTYPAAIPILFAGLRPGRVQK